MLQVNNLEDYKKEYEKSPGNTNRYFTDPPFMHRYNAIAELIPDGSTVLDVGCNTGSMGNNLRNKKNCIDYGIDISDIWKKYIPEEFHSRYKVGMAEELYPKLIQKVEVFDVVVCSEVLEHLLDVDVVMKQILKVLHFNGIFVGSVPHDKGRRGNGHYKLDTDCHMREFTKESLEQLLLKYFADVKVTEQIRHTNDKGPEFYIFKAHNKKILV